MREACNASEALLAGARSCLALQMHCLSGLQVTYGRARKSAVSSAGCPNAQWAKTCMPLSFSLSGAGHAEQQAGEDRRPASDWAMCARVE